MTAGQGWYDWMGQQIAGQMQAQQSGIEQQRLAGQQLGLQHQQSAAFSSQPSDEREFYGTMPAELPETLPIGARWDCNFNNDRGALVTVATLDHGFAGGPRYVGQGLRDDGDGGERKASIRPGWVDWSTVRRLSAPSADKWEPKPGDFVRGRTTEGSYHGPDVDVQGWYLCPMAGNSSASMISFERDGEADACVSTSTLRPATPSPKAAEATPPPCPHRNVNLLTMRCDDCGMTAAQAAGRLQGPDPYAATPHGMNDAQVAAEMGRRNACRGRPRVRPPNAHDLRVAAWKAAHLADFDRKVKPRHPSDWDVADTDELRVT